MKLICDFCSAPEVKWSYPCKSFDFITNIISSEGDWAACDKCHFLIENKLNQTLAENAIGDTGLPLTMMLQLHDMFRTNRIGEARLITF